MRLPTDEERAIIDGLHRGDQGAVGRLFELYGGPIRDLVLRPRIRDRFVVEDLLQETFLVAAERASTFQWKGASPYYWLRAIALNKLKNHSRAGARDSSRLIPLETMRPWIQAPDDLERSVEIKERLSELRIRVRQVLDLLPERYQKVIALRLVQGLGRPEAARELGVSINHLDVLLYRALRRFTALYGTKGAGEEGDSRG